MTRKGLLVRLDRRQSFVSPLWNRLPVLMMAAGRLHLETISRHQWAEEVAVPKLADPSAGESELSVGTSATRIREKQSPGGCQTTVMSVDRSDRPATMVMSMISVRMYLADCRMMMHRHQECHSRSVRMLQVQPRSR